MSDLSEMTALQKTVGSIDRKVPVGQILEERKLAQHFSGDLVNAGSYLSLCRAEATARASVRQVNEKLFVLDPPAARAPVIRQFEIEQEFEGTVVAVDLSDGTFTARLADLTDDGPEEEGEFALDELNGDQSLVFPGAVFTWTVGLQTRGPTGQRIRVSDIRFRRMPSVSQQVIARAENEARDLSRFLRETESAEPFTGRL